MSELHTRLDAIEARLARLGGSDHDAWRELRAGSKRTTWSMWCFCAIQCIRRNKRVAPVASH